VLLTALVVLLAERAFADNEPCAGDWNSAGDCICINHNVCTNSYGGTAEEGSPGNYPCPNDGADVWGCVLNCPGVSGLTLCTWSNECTGTVISGKINL
jgi:hypothetical protein